MRPDNAMTTVLDAMGLELGLWQRAGLVARFWVRDDDACEVTPALSRLADLATRHGIEIGLAVIPEKLQPDLIAYLCNTTTPFYPLCHGWRHANYGHPGAPAEFGADRPLPEMLRELASAQATFSRAFPVAPVFVPPFNRIADNVAAELAALGFAGLSCGSPLRLQRAARLHSRTAWLPRIPYRRSMPAPGAHAQIDPVDWTHRTARPLSAIAATLLGELRLRRKNYIPPSEPVGILLHHLIHDATIWEASDRLLSVIRSSPAAVFPGVAELFATRPLRLPASAAHPLQKSSEPCVTQSAADTHRAAPPDA